ncbi:four helix bundle protein [Marixanthomonas ophiurae]|uniref:Four helix bundle protein n=1 Tax=Marixanthomonas ophiurae TaxID=387659 RepID=A0A3E1Q696_9FLAO|nr:four helix bundle protein [Marixanthomonas ophiurae]RFN57655.1 four helix bundle protein [Marixanthomonas ophiurae]
MHRFKQLEVWKKSRAFCKHIYKITILFPESEKFGLVNQLRRASVSVPSNIAEGASRKSNKDFARFLEIAIGSCYEMETQIILSNDLGFIDKKTCKLVLEDLETIIKMTSKFKSTLK